MQLWWCRVVVGVVDTVVAAVTFGRRQVVVVVQRHDMPMACPMVVVVAAMGAAMGG